MSDVINLGEGAMPHGTAEREVLVAILLLTIRDYLKPATRADAMDWLETRAGEEACSWVGIPAPALRKRLLVIVASPELLQQFTRMFCRRSPAEIYAGLMAA